MSREFRQAPPPARARNISERRRTTHRFPEKHHSRGGGSMDGITILFTFATGLSTTSGSSMDATTRSFAIWLIASCRTIDAPTDHHGGGKLLRGMPLTCLGRGGTPTSFVCGPFFFSSLRMTSNVDVAVGKRSLCKEKHRCLPGQLTRIISNPCPWHPVRCHVTLSYVWRGKSRGSTGDTQSGLSSSGLSRRCAHLGN